MTKLFRIAALLLLTGFPAFAQNSPNDETGRIIALEHAWKRAIEAKDTKALEQILAPTFVGVETDGSLANKSAFLASIKDPSYQPSQAVYEDIRAEIYGDTAITIGVFRIRETQKGKTHYFASAFHRYLDQERRHLAMRRQPGHPYPRQIVHGI